MKKLLAVVLVLSVASVAMAQSGQTIADAIANGDVSGADLLLYMPYDETSGNVTADMSGNGNDGTIFYTNTNNNGTSPAVDTGTLWVPGKFGNALQGFNDGDKKVMDAHMIGDGNGDYNGVADVSIAFWAKRTGRHIGWGSSWANIWSTDITENPFITSDETSVDWSTWNGGLQYDLLHHRYDEWAPGDTNRRINMGFSAGGAWEKFDMFEGDGDRLFDGPDNDGWGDDEWHHIALIIDGDPAGGETTRFNVTVYVDGVAQNLVSESGWGWGNFNIDAITVGANESIKGIDVNDQFDDYGVWTRLLSEEEVQALYIPEPATMSLLGLGALALLRKRR